MLFAMLPSSPAHLLKQAKTPAFLVSDLVNLRYLTGLTLSAGFLLVTPRRAFLFVDSRYTDMAHRRARNVTVKDIGELPAALKALPVCGFESESVTVSRFLNWKKKFPSTKFVRTTGVIAAFRRQKSEEELRLMRRARRLTQELLRRVPAVLRRSTTEEKLARQLLIWALELGADGLSFEPIVAFGNHTSSPHHRPTNRLLQKGHIVQIDVGVLYKGYCGDLSEVYFTAPPTAEQKKIYETLVRSQQKAIRAVKAGVTTHTLDKIARGVLAEQGMEKYFTHALGHGVGLDVHEGVTLSQRAPAQKLLPGEVITIEPGVYLPGKFGMRVEEMVIVP